MRVHRIATMLPALLFATAASAQQTEQPATPTPPPSASPQQSATPTKQGPSATPAELVAEGEGILRRGMVVNKTVRRMLEDARKEADIIRITCLDDKLTQINANLRSAENRLEALRNAVDSDRRVHEYTVLTVLGQKLQVLDQEAHQCVGEALYETGETKVVTEIDTDMLPFEETPSTPPVVLPPSLPTIPPPASGTS